MKTFLSVFVLVLMIPAQGFSYSKKLKHEECSCVSEMQAELDKEADRFEANYQSKYGTNVKLDNDAQYLEGKDKDEAVILIHGFIASPYEVRSVAKSLNDVGYSVYMPLLYGFGSDGQIANEGKVEIWRKQIKGMVDKLSHCYKKISIGGISLGGALATDYVLSNDNAKIKSLLLLSPYYDISQSVAKLLVGPLSNLKESVDLTTLYTVSRSDDLVEILKHREFYSNIMPLVTLNELFKLSDELKAHHQDVKSNVPVFLAYSEHDTTIDLEAAKNLPKEKFKKVSSFVLEEKLKVPHQIAYEESNPKFYKMMSKMIRFIGVSNFDTDN